MAVYRQFEGPAMIRKPAWQSLRGTGGRPTVFVVGERIVSPTGRVRVGLDEGLPRARAGRGPASSIC